MKKNYALPTVARWRRGLAGGAAAGGFSPGGGNLATDRVAWLLLETVGEGVAWLDADGTILFCNACLAQMLQKPVAHLAGTPLRAHVSLSDHAAWQALNQPGLLRGTGELHLLTASGTARRVGLTVGTISANGRARATSYAVVSTLGGVVPAAPPLPQPVTWQRPLPLPEKMGEQAAQPPTRLLWVGDHGAHRLAMRPWLRQWNVQTDYADDGAAAAEMVRRKHYNLVLLDLPTPNFAVYAIRSLPDPLRQCMPIAVLSAEPLPVWAQETDVTNWLASPPDPAQLRRLLVAHPQTAVPAAPPTVSYRRIEYLAGGDEDQRRKLTQCYIRHLEQLQGEFQAALDGHDWSGLRAVADKVRRAADVLKARGLAHEVQQLTQLVAAPVAEGSLRRAASGFHRRCGAVLEDLRSNLTLAQAS